MNLGEEEFSMLTGNISVISSLNKGVKLNTKNKKFGIYLNTRFQGILRFKNNESRQDTINKIIEIIEKLNLMIMTDTYVKFDNLSKEDFMKYIHPKLGGMIKGLSMLISTYEEDEHFKGRIDYQIYKLKSFAKYIEEKLNIPKIPESAPRMEDSVGKHSHINSPKSELTLSPRSQSIKINKTIEDSPYSTYNSYNKVPTILETLKLDPIKQSSDSIKQISISSSLQQSSLPSISSSVEEENTLNIFDNL